jgi:ABC-type uncharacterized transport system permease subunit
MVNSKSSRGGVKFSGLLALISGTFCYICHQHLCFCRLKKMGWIKVPNIAIMSVANWQCLRCTAAAAAIAWHKMK